MKKGSLKWQSSELIPNTDHNCAQQWCQAYICRNWVLVCRESHYWVLTVTTKYETKESRGNITWL